MVPITASIAARMMYFSRGGPEGASGSSASSMMETLSMRMMLTT